MNSSWIGDAVTGVGDGLFSGSARLGVSNKPVETDPEFKSSFSLSLPEGGEHENLLVFQPLLPHKLQPVMGQKWKDLIAEFLGQTATGERK